MHVQRSFDDQCLLRVLVLLPRCRIVVLFFSYSIVILETKPVYELEGERERGGERRIEDRSGRSSESVRSLRRFILRRIDDTAKPVSYRSYQYEYNGARKIRCV